jgi:hypothetical protein
MIEVDGVIKAVFHLRLPKASESCSWPDYIYAPASLSTQGRRQLLLLVQLVQVKSACPRQGDTCPSQGSCPRVFVQVIATCQWQYYLSKLSKSRPLVEAKTACNDLIVRVKVATCQACLSMTACPSQGYLSGLLVNGHFPSQGSSMARPLVQGWLSNNNWLVKAKTACPSLDCLSMTALSKSRLLVRVKAASQDYLSKTTCRRQGCLSNFQVKADHFVRSKATR